jgi:hypothetical protein
MKMKKPTAAGDHPKRNNFIFSGKRPKAPGVIAPRFMAMFADIERPRRRAYLAAYVQEGGDTVRTRKTAGCGGWHNEWLRADPEYRAAFERAKRAVAAQREVCRRARRAAPSNAGLMSMLRYLRRERYGGIRGRKR